MIASLGDRPFFFLHLPKTAGTSFSEWLAWHFDPASSLALKGADDATVDARAARLDGHRFVHGHAPYDMRRAFRTPPFVFTVLRDPIERAVSAFHHLRQDASALTAEADLTDPRIRATAEAGRTSLAGFIRAHPETAAAHCGNRQVLLLSRPWQPGYFQASHAQPPHTTQAELDRACENLVACDAMGVAERMAETAELLAHALRIPLPRYPGWANRTAERPAVQALDQETLDLLHGLTQHDQALHRFAATLFEDRRRAMMRDLLDDHARRSAPPALSDDPVSAFAFDRPIPGEGWYPPERHGEAHLAWTGPDALSWLLLRSPAGPGDARLELDVAHALLPDQLTRAALRVNGWPVARDLSAAPDGHRITAPVPAWLLRPHGEANRIEVIVTPLGRPCDILPGNADARLLGLAIRRIALRRDAG